MEIQRALSGNLSEAKLYRPKDHGKQIFSMKL